MADRLLQSLVHTVRRDAAADADDVDLLQRFVTTRDATAFELLVWRHGAMVESVCRRALGNSPEVEDAFQATFVALLKQANSIRKQMSVAGWLHRVALRIARRVRYTTMRRRRREEAKARPDLCADALSDAADLSPVLHEEIDHLPARFRLPLVYCHLEGRSVDEAARLLGVPRGTVLSRLSRGRERLRRALVRRGIVPAAAALALAESESTVSAALVTAAVRTIKQGPSAAGPVADLAQGVIRDMMLTKLKTTASIALVLGLLGVGTMFLNQPAASARPDDKPSVPARPGAAQKPATDLDRLQGKWNVTAVRVNGKDQEEAGTATFEFKGEKLLFKKRPDHDGDELTIKIDSSKKPAAIDLDKKGRISAGIYELKGDTLRLCIREKSEDRPTEFAAEKDSNAVLLEMKRDKPAAKPQKDDPLSDDVNKLKEEVLRLRKELALERDRNQRLELERKLAQTRAEEARDVAEAAQKNAQTARNNEQVARIEAESQRKQAELARVRTEAALKEAQKALEDHRKAAEKTKPEKKEESEFDSVFLLSQHWYLYFKNDGSGFVGTGAQSGSGINKRVSFPKGTLDAAKARRDIENSMSESGSRSAGFDVQLRSGKEKIVRGHINDTKITRPLFETAFKKCEDKSTLNRLLKDHPSILRDE